ncbi:hypothetical protein ACX8XN_04855 [Calditrichota bacterium GD2]
MQKVASRSGLFSGFHHLGSVMARGMKHKPKLLLSLLILVMCQSFDLVYAKDIEYACLTVSVDQFSKNPRQVCRFINQLLQLDYPVYRCAQHKEIGKITLRPGDFIVVTEKNRRKVLFIDYLKSENFVNVRDIDLPLEVEAYPLKRGKLLFMTAIMLRMEQICT